MRVRLPLRLAVGRLLLDGASRTACDVCTALEPEYAGERQINAANIEAQLQALQGRGYCDRLQRIRSGRCVRNHPGRQAAGAAQSLA